MAYWTRISSPVGELLLESDGYALTGLWMNRSPQGEETPELPVFCQTRWWLEAYFSGEERPVDFPVRARGTAFQTRVWEKLEKIPFGRTRTYGDLAKELARDLGREKMSAQAVGGAVGANPISILIPCHRVVGAGGRLTGYAGGLEKKQWLLRHEGWKGEEK